ncbi:MAG: signal peptidase I [Candidatus Omnitrophota bacterium]
MRFNKKSWNYWWKEWIKPILIAAVLALIIRTFVVQPFKIPSNSMYPTLKPGDRIFVSKFIYGAKIPFTNIRLPEVREPMFGDIVVFLSPEEKKKYLVKRYIASGGDRVQIKDGSVYVNGEEKVVLVEDENASGGETYKRAFYFGRDKYGIEGKIIHVPEGHFYVLGDNSANSRDSRYWGFVPGKNLVGKVFVIYWPIGRWQLIRGTGESK